jgi:hypothetical protein
MRDAVAEIDLALCFSCLASSSSLSKFSVSLPHPDPCCWALPLGYVLSLHGLGLALEPSPEGM